MHRTQILFPEEEYRRLREVAQEEGRSVGALVREAVAKHYPGPSRERRIAAVKRMLEMDVPAPDWPQMEEEIIRGFLADE
jgi:hypothetical protein